MTTYARLVDGFALDVQSAASANDLAARYHADWLAKNQFSVVPDDTLHGRSYTLSSDQVTIIWGSNPTVPAPIQSQEDRALIGVSDMQSTIRARAAILVKQGKYAEATVLLQTIGV